MGTNKIQQGLCNLLWRFTLREMAHALQQAALVGPSEEMLFVGRARGRVDSVDRAMQDQGGD